ncbi:hypothetical protein D3C76_1399290 [compost metagenome]
MGSFAVQEAAMNRRFLLIVLLGLLTTACAPYGGDGYYRSEVYTVDRYSYPGYRYDSPYNYNRGYYIAPQPRYYPQQPYYYRQSPYYRPTPHYYRPAPAPGYHRYYPGRGPDPRYRHSQPRYDQDRNHDGRRDSHYRHSQKRYDHNRNNDGRQDHRGWSR